MNVEQLKNSILQLAIEGPTSDLLREIKAKKPL